MSDAEQVENVEQEPSVADVEPQEVEAQEPVSVEPSVPDHLAKRIEGLESAVSATRKEKQELQRRLDYISGQIAGQSRNQEPKKQVPVISEEEFWSDPVTGAAKVADYAVRNALTKAEQARLDQEKARIDRASNQMRKKHEDYADIEQEFLEASRIDPALAYEARTSINPAEYVYEWGKAKRAMASNTDSDKRIAELEAQIAKLTGATATLKTQAGARSAGATVSGGSDIDPYEQY